MLEMPIYTIELWDSGGQYTADVSDIITGALKISFKLNDVEKMSFALDLVQFEQKCARIGASPRNIIDPYRTDVRIRRNGEYIVGCQVVRVVADFNNEASNKINVDCTGYLNYFKDRYVSASLENKTYAQIARELITLTQAQTNGNFGVILGTDGASSSQTGNRVRNYDIQNVKDGIINLTKLENDKFDFTFSADKVFSVYTRLGSNLPRTELVFPQNIYKMSVIRDASTLANKIIAIGSGIGEERIESTVIDQTSALTYRVRERTELFNSIINESELEANALGALEVYKDMYEIPTLSVEPGALDINTVKVGDAITIRVDGSTFIDNIDGLYRIIAMDVSVNDGVESVDIDVIPWS